jgi:ribosomal protein S18 acetylase RimI-like enzyme
MEDGRALGLALYERTPEKGSLRAIVVHPDFRRRGVGTTLMRHAMRSLRWQGHGTYRVWPAPPHILLGGGYHYIWPGVPEDLADSKGFFDAVLGWPFSEPCYDMTMSLDGFSPPTGCYNRAATAGVTFRSAALDDMPAVLAFEEREFPNWVRYVREHAPEDMVIGVDREGAIVASLLFDMPPILWSRLLGDDAAEIGAVGVAESRRNLGLGTALVARACEILRDRGVEVAVLRWLYRVSFYRRVGFTVWKQYLMSSTTFS